MLASAKRAARFGRAYKNDILPRWLLTAHSPMLAPCVRGWLLPVRLLSANPTRFDIQRCSTQGRYVCNGKEAQQKKPCLQEISKDLGGRVLGVKHEPGGRT